MKTFVWTSERFRNAMTNRTQLALAIASLLLPWSAMWLAATSLSADQHWSGALVLCVVATATMLALVLWLSRPGNEVLVNRLGFTLAAFAVTANALFASIVLGFQQSSPFAVVSLLTLLTWLLGRMSVKAPRNRIIGFRTRRTLASESVWQEVNQRYGRLLQFSALGVPLSLLFPPYEIVVSIIPAVAVAIVFLASEARGYS